MSVSTGYSGTPLARKLGIVEGTRLVVRHAPGDYAQWLVIAAEFCQQIKIILTGVRVAGDKYHHQRFVIDQRFWSMTESGWRIIKGRQFTRRQFQHFQRRLACCAL